MAAMSLLGKDGTANVQRLQAQFEAIEHGNADAAPPDLAANRALVTSILRAAGAGSK